MNQHVTLAVVLAASLSMPGLAAAGCGSAFCTISTDWGTQGQWTGPGGRFDLRFEFIDQNQPKHGAERVSLGEVPEETEEVQTINRNWIAQFAYNFDTHWGMTATVPLINRYHHHIVEGEGGPTPEQWAFTELGDARLLGSYQLTLGADVPVTAGIALGLKLPTGSFNVTNDEGVAAERMLQPGTGTVDGIATVFVNRPLGPMGSIFAQFRFEGAFDSRDDYRPGNRLFFDIGYNRLLTTKLGAHIQLNVAFKRPEQGTNAEPEVSGGTYVYLAPGLSYDISHAFQVYGFIQLPLYQYVNGVQLTANWAAMAGLSWRF